MDYLEQVVYFLAIGGIGFLLYDELTHQSRDWIRRHTLPFPDYPWFVRLDYWLYHIDSCRVQQTIHEHHVWFGGLFKRVGRPVSFLSQ